MFDSNADCRVMRELVIFDVLKRDGI